MSKLIALLLGAIALVAQPPEAKIARAQSRLPWFWSPSSEGMADLPYTYDVTLEQPRPGGDELDRWSVLRLEYVRLERGSQIRCLAQDGRTPCSQAWLIELERQNTHRAAMTEADWAGAKARSEENRARRRAFWAAFPTAFVFEAAGPNRLRFKPRTPAASLAGELAFDPETFEVTAMRYEFTRDTVEPFLRYPKGTRFAIELSRLADGHWLPHRISTVVRGRERVSRFENYRRFAASSEIHFADPPEH